MEKVAEVLPRAPEGLIAPVAAAGEEHPRVGFDVRLGKTFSSIDFDTEGYANYLRSRGLDAHDVANAHVEIMRPGGLRNLLFRGHYRHKRERMEVYVGAESKAEDVNTAIYHETEHYIDALEGKLFGTFHKVRKEIGLWGLECYVASVIYGVHDVIAGNQDLSDAYITSFTSMGIALGGLCLYAVDPAERRAFKAQKKHTQPLADFSLR